MPNRLLIVDDEPELCNFVERVAHGVGFETNITTRAEDFKQAFQEWKPTAIMLDLVIPEIDGIELLRWLIGENCRASIIILSGFDARILDAARRVGKERGLEIAFTLSKPIRAQELKEKLTSLYKPEPAALTPDDVYQGLKEEQLFLYFQPKVSLADGSLKGTEALLRWLHPTRGVIMPDEILALAENTPLIEALTEFVLKRACQQQRAWRKEGMDYPVSVNISASSLYDEHLADRIGEICAVEDVPAKSVMLEITETAAMSHALEALDILTRLRLKGFQLSIDDFGIGFSSLSRLRRIPANELKIDKSFVLEAPTSAQGLAIVKTVISLAKNMEMVCVAEGIESARHYRMLAELGCDLGQGFAIAKPMSGEKLSEWKVAWQPPYQKRRYAPRPVDSSSAAEAKQGEA